MKAEKQHGRVPRRYQLEVRGEKGVGVLASAQGGQQFPQGEVHSPIIIALIVNLPFHK